MSKRQTEGLRGGAAGASRRDAPGSAKRQTESVRGGAAARQFAMSFDGRRLRITRDGSGEVTWALLPPEGNGDGALLTGFCDAGFVQELIRAGAAVQAMLELVQEEDAG